MSCEFAERDLRFGELLEWNLDLPGRLTKFDAVFCGALGKPIAQAQSGFAVVFVVVGDALKKFPGLVGLSAVAQLAVVGISDNRSGGIGHVAVAAVLTHVERLEFLDAVRALSDPQAGADDRVQVHEHVLAEQRVHRLLADTVTCGQAQQRRFLVRGVVVDVHAWMSFSTRGDVIEEVEERLALTLAIVCPERLEHVVVRRPFDYTEQILQPPIGGPVLGPERIALEVEEDVAVVGDGESAERRGFVDLEFGVAGHFLA